MTADPRPAPPRTTEPPPSTAVRPKLTTRVRVLIGLVTVGLVAWFFFAWLGLHRDIVDAAGESIGSALLLLVLLSVVSAVRHRRPRDDTDRP